MLILPLPAPLYHTRHVPLSRFRYLNMLLHFCTFFAGLFSREESRVGDRFWTTKRGDDKHCAGSRTSAKQSEHNPCCLPTAFSICLGSTGSAATMRLSLNLNSMLHRSKNLACGFVYRLRQQRIPVYDREGGSSASAPAVISCSPSPTQLQ